jgi:predicted acetyltransferase
MGIEVRHVRDEELPAYFDAVTTAFLQRPDVEKLAAGVRPHWDLERTWAALDGQVICGTFRSWATELTLPGGGRMPAAAVSGVTVLPTHRRRGILRALVAAEHEQIRRRGEVCGLLYASEYPIYGRFGYGPACRVATWTLDALAARFHAPTTSGVEMIKRGEQSRDLLRTVFDAWRTRQPGEIRRRHQRWDLDTGLIDEPWSGRRWNGFLAVHRDSSGTVDGYARYKVEEKEEHLQPRGMLTINEMHALTDEAGAALWRFLAQIDLIATVKADNRSPSERLPWLLTNARAAVASDIGDGIWLRLFDIPRALEARSYEREGSVVLEVVDAEAAEGRTRVHLDVDPDGATCRLTDRGPDLTLDIAALGAAYLGGARLRDAVLAHGADEHRAGALALADSLLRTADEPWCSTHF